MRISEAISRSLKNYLFFDLFGVTSSSSLKNTNIGFTSEVFDHICVNEFNTERFNTKYY